jgi:hypothetical protein
MLRSVDWWLVTDVSEQSICLIQGSSILHNFVTDYQSILRNNRGEQRYQEETRFLTFSKALAATTLLESEPDCRIMRE